MRFALFSLLAACIETNVEKVKEDEPDGLRQLEVDPGVVDFGVLSDPTEVTSVVTVTSIGDLPATVSTVDISGSSAYGLTWASEETTLEPGDTMDVIVSYVPASASDLGTLVVNSDAVEPQLVVDLVGAGSYPAIAVEPSSVSFRSEYGESVDEEVVVTSVGTADLEISSMLVEGSWFSAEGDIPVTLAPGESITLDVTYTPLEEDETVDGKIWLTTNTAQGFAIVPLEAHNGPLCMGMGEAWDRGLLDAHTLFNGLTLDVTNLSTDDDLCDDWWYVFLSDDSQDMGVGDMDGDLGSDYPTGSLTLGPGENEEFKAAELSGSSWWCMEDTQYTQRSADYTFIGAYVPEPMLSYMLDGDQNAVWSYQNDNAVMIAARDTNYVEVGQGGGSAVVTLRTLNMGSRNGASEYRETIPAGYTASDFSVAPVRTEAGAEGATVYVWGFDLDARVKTDDYSPTTYDEETVSYTLTVPPCIGRQYLPLADSRWTDSGGASRVAYANPLVVNCVE